MPNATLYAAQIDGFRRENSPQNIGSSHSSEVFVAARRTIQLPESPVASFGSILSGWATRIAPLPKGQRGVLAILLPGDMFGADNLVDGRVEQHIVAVTDCRVRIVMPQIRDYSSLARDPRLSSQLLHMLAHERQRLEWHLAAVAGLPAFQRVAWFVLDLLERLEARGMASREAFHLPLTQQEIADLLGVTKAHLNRVLLQFRKAELMTFGRGRVEIHDPDGLRSLGSFGSIGSTKVAALPG
jgi:CRP-like cAMP-binding protein